MSSNTKPPSQIQPHELPILGIGLGLRRSLHSETMGKRQQIDWLEIVPENYMGKGGKSIELLDEACDTGFPIISHGVNLSIGSVDPLNERYLNDLQALFRRIQPAWFSDHLCFSSVSGAYFNDLIPLQYTWEAVEHVVKRIKAVQARFDIPFLIENISYYCAFPSSELTEAQFLSEVLERSDCGLLLDVNNVYVNAHNHGYDPLGFLREIPLERTVQLHVAGHLKKRELIVDTHGSPVCADVFDLLETLLEMTPVNGILLERDIDIPPMSELLVELAQIRQIAQRVAARQAVIHSEALAS